MIELTKRNLKLFFRDKSAVFYSLLAIIIIIGLYALFLGDTWVRSLSNLSGVRFMMDSWIMAGILSVTSVTTTMGAFGTMIDDKAKKIFKDFYASPTDRRYFFGGYLLNAIIIGIIMSVISTVIFEVYIVINGGKLLSVLALLKVFGIIILSTLSSTSLIFLLVSFFKSQNAFGTASTVVGTLIGFVTGIYIPIGSLPEGVQYIIKLFPVSYSTSLFREVIMEAPLAASFKGIPVEYLDGFKEEMGVVYKFGGYAVEPWLSVVILIAAAALFYTLAILNISRKKRK